MYSLDFEEFLCALYGRETKVAILNNTIKGNVKGGIYENAIGESLVKRGYKFASANIGYTDDKLTLPHYMVMFL